MLKVPIFIDLANEALDNGYSIAIFVNFRETMEHLCKQLNTECVVHGQQTMAERQGCIDDFQSNKVNTIVAIMQAGSVAISLHDIHGGHPRMSLISPSFSGQDLVQALGRVHRANGKTPCFQRIIFCAKTFEEKISERVMEKLKNLSAINDGDFVGPNIKTEQIDTVNKYVEDQSAKYSAGFGRI